MPSRQHSIMLLLLAGLLPATAGAGKLKLTPTLQLGLTYSDNLRLDSAQDKQHAWITEVSPGLEAQMKSARLSLNLDYRMQNAYYAPQSGHDTAHKLKAQANFEAVPDLVFVDGYARVRREDLSPLGRRGQSQLLALQNEIRSYGISPYIRARLSNSMYSELRYLHQHSSTDRAGLADSVQNALSWQLVDAAEGKRLNWDLGLYHNRTNNDEVANYSQQQLRANMRYRFTPKTGLMATAGYERFDYLAVNDEKPEGEVLMLGVFWQPTIRTRMEVSAGKRFFGTNYAFSASQRVRFGRFRAEYNEDITTAQSEFLLPLNVSLGTGQGTVELTDNVNVESNRIFLQKRFLLGMNIGASKNDFNASFSHTRRLAQTDQLQDSALFGVSNLSINDDVRLWVLDTIWDWHLNRRTDFSVRAYVVKEDYLARQLENNYGYWSLSVKRRLQRDIRGSVVFKRNQRDASVISPGYRENSLAATLLFQL